MIIPLLSIFPMPLFGKGTKTIVLVVFSTRGQWYFITWGRRLFLSTPDWLNLGGFHWLRLPRCPFYLGKGVLCYPPYCTLGCSLPIHKHLGNWHSLEFHYYQWGSGGIKSPNMVFKEKLREMDLEWQRDTIMDPTKWDQVYLAAVEGITSAD